MEYAERDKCTLDGKLYMEGVEFCDTEKCMRCEGGNWESRFIDRVFGVGP